MVSRRKLISQNVSINEFQRVNSRTNSLTYCSLLLIKISSWQFCGGVDFLKLIDKYIASGKFVGRASTLHPSHHFKRKWCDCLILFLISFILFLVSYLICVRLTHLTSDQDRVVLGLAARNAIGAANVPAGYVEKVKWVDRKPACLAHRKQPPPRTLLWAYA
jgi:hypothetical protein